jgi:thiamine pyrophosphate-dependent acetolactate synthase large subunit-like protein
MGMGSLATIGVQRPSNLAVIVFDNQRYGETGMQASHTDKGVDLVGVAKSCGIARAFDVEDEAGLKKLAGELAGLNERLFARVHIAADEPQRVLPTKDGVELKLRFRRAVAAAG